MQLMESACIIKTRDGGPYLRLLAARPNQHRVCFMPLLHFLRVGLDPTLTSQHSPQSALQIAREHVQAHPLTSPAAKRELQEEMEKSGCGSGGTPRDFAMDHVTQSTTATWPGEWLRRAKLHSQFVHALMSAWRAHSSQVRALLEEPLIPDLANICAEYLDLEPAEEHQK